jgi:predicted metal-dependent HD superfamily phosphohydrolase
VTRKKELIVEIEKLHNTPIDDIPPESKFLLDCKLKKLKAADNDYQEHWIEAILAAKRAGLPSSTSTRGSINNLAAPFFE